MAVCKAFTENNRPCRYEASVNGYCIRHFWKSQRGTLPKVIEVLRNGEIKYIRVA